MAALSLPTESPACGNANRRLRLTPPSIDSLSTSHLGPITRATRRSTLSDIEQLKLELKQVETERDAALALARSRSELVSHVSHEMRTPLNGILGMAQLLLEMDPSGDQREFMELINSSGESLLTLVNDLLDHSKIEAGKLSLDAVAFDVAHLVRDTVRSLDLAAAAKGLTTSHSVDPEVPSVVVGDPGRIRQVLVNLIGNAVKFTHDGGIIVSASLDSTSGSRAVIRFAVEDSGIGMSGPQASAVFQPFEQADSSTGRVYGGTGLGLTISQKLVELMGGRIWLESEEGTGSTFLFSVEVGTVLPKKDQTSEMPADRSELEIVVLTDSERRVVAEGTTGARVRTIRLSSSSEATDALIPALKKKTAHIIVLDFRDHSLQAAAGVLPVSGAAKIVILTPSGQRGDAARCRELNISAYLTGSVAASDISSAIDAMVDGVPGLITRHWLRERSAGTSG